MHVEPLFEHANVRSAAETEQLLGIEIDLKLSASAPWVTTPASMVLTSGLDRVGTTLQSGSMCPPCRGAHFARVIATDASDPSRGPLFTLPVTVVIPHEGDECSTEASKTPSSCEALKLSLPAGRPIRRFLVAPDSAEWAQVKLVTHSMPKGPHSVILHAVPSARGDVPNTALQVKKMMMLRENSEETVHIPVKGGSTMELAMQLSWLANPNPVDLEAIIEYGSYGMRGSAVATDRPLLIGAAETYARFEVSAPLRTEKVSPKAELTSVERAIRPVKYEIKAGSAELDVLPPSDAQLAEDATFAGTQIHQMILSYNFEVATKDDEKLSVIPRVAALHEQLYDSALDSMLWKLETADTGAVIGWGGLIHDSDPLKLRKGKYKVSVLLRHTAPSQLEALKDLPLLLKMDLPKAA